MLDNDSVWATPVRHGGTPPDATPTKLQRVDTVHGSIARGSAGDASGETPLTTTASSLRTVHVCGSPTYSPDASPELSGTQDAAKLLQLQQAQLQMVETVVALNRARARAGRHASGASSRDGDGSDTGSKALSRRAARHVPVLPRGPVFEDSHPASRSSVHVRKDDRPLSRDIPHMIDQPLTSEVLRAHDSLAGRHCLSQADGSSEVLRSGRSLAHTFPGRGDVGVPPRVPCSGSPADALPSHNTGHVLRRARQIEDADRRLRPVSSVHRRPLPILPVVTDTTPTRVSTVFPHDSVSNVG